MSNCLCIRMMYSRMYIMMISFTFCMHQSDHNYRQHCHCNTAGVQNMPGMDNIVHYNIPAAFTASNIPAAYNSYCKQHSCCTQQLLQHSCCTQHSHWWCHGNTTGVHDVTGTVWAYNIVTATFLVLLQHSYTALSWQQSWCTHHWHGNTAGVHTIPMATSLVYTTLLWQHSWCTQHCWCTHHSYGNIPGVHNTGMATFLVYTTFLWQHSWCTQHWYGNTAGVHSTVLATLLVYTTRSSHHSHLTQHCHCSKHSCSTTCSTQRNKTHTYTFGKLIEMHCDRCFGGKIAINMSPQ